MGKGSKTTIFILVVLMAGLLLLRPYLWPSGGDVEFTTTSNPQTVMDRALFGGKPIFLEFYSDT
jgi:hypothetical protein